MEFSIISGGFGGPFGGFGGSSSNAGEWKKVIDYRVWGCFEFKTVFSAAQSSSFNSGFGGFGGGFSGSNANGNLNIFWWKVNFVYINLNFGVAAAGCMWSNKNMIRGNLRC